MLMGAMTSRAALREELRTRLEEAAHGVLDPDARFVWYPRHRIRDLAPDRLAELMGVPAGSIRLYQLDLLVQDRLEQGADAAAAGRLRRIVRANLYDVRVYEYEGGVCILGQAPIGGVAGLMAGALVHA